MLSLMYNSSSKIFFDNVVSADFVDDAVSVFVVMFVPAPVVVVVMFSFASFPLFSFSQCLVSFFLSFESFDCLSFARAWLFCCAVLL